MFFLNCISLIFRRSRASIEISLNIPCKPVNVAFIISTKTRSSSKGKSSETIPTKLPVPNCSSIISCAVNSALNPSLEVFVLAKNLLTIPPIIVPISAPMAVPTPGKIDPINAPAPVNPP